jgi:cysteinyl-tRNA synthetase
LADLKASLEMLGIAFGSNGYVHGARRSLERAFDTVGLTREEIAGSLVREETVSALITAREAARRAKNFAESDRLRDELAAMGIALKDGKDADGNPTTTWEMKR